MISEITKPLFLFQHIYSKIYIAVYTFSNRFFFFEKISLNNKKIHQNLFKPLFHKIYMENEVPSTSENRENSPVHKESKLTEKLRTNPWILSTIILGILSIVLLSGNLSGVTGGVITGNAISVADASQKVLDFANAQVEGDVELVDAELLASGLYQVTIKFQGNNIPLYLTADGKNLVQGVVPLDSLTKASEPATTEIPQTDKPEVGLYIWSYCPYGVTALGPFSQVASLLENTANFKVYLYYAGHGDFEEQQNKIQACIQDLGSDKYWDYAETFANTIYKKCSGDIDCDLEESVKLMDTLGIDSDKVLSCVESKGADLLEEDFNAAKSVGVTGSPSLVINGVKANVARNAEAYKSAVCSAYSDAPSDCGETLDSTSATASGSC